ncbi:MAG: PVC-type heme-binding CxxCH protein, partial [Candidatus Hydrogenedentota bacterium]
MPLQRNATLILALSICISSLAQDPEVLNSLTVPEGFTVELAASSDFTSYPMFMAFDDQGRLFIAESTGKDLSGKEMAAEPECQILRLEDTDGDGVYDTRTIFATELSLPMGVLWHQGSLFVASPPDFLRFDDNDGDGISDHREVILTGWNVFNTASLHGPFLGPDGRLYLTHGRHGYKIETKEGEILEGLAARIWRCWPDGTGLERFAGGGFDNPVELTFTPGGEMIGTMTYFTDPRHGKRDALLHFVQGGVYPKPHDAVKEFIRTGPDFMPVMTEFSRIAPSGLERFRSSGFGAEYQGSLFSAQFNPHRVQRHKLIREGATFRTEDEDFLTSSYPDFYPTDVLEDADGSLLVSDTGAWYVDACPISRVAKPQIKGAIYRIRKTSTTPHSDPWGNKIDWTSRTTQQLIEDLDDSRVRVQDRALQGLIARFETAVPLLAEALKSNSDPQVRLLALTGLRQVIGEGRKAAILDALKDDSLDVRLKAIQAAGDSLDPQALQVLYALLPKGSPAELRGVFTTLAKYPDPSVTGKTLTVLNNLETPADPFLEHAIIYTLIQQKNSDELFAALSASDSNNLVRRAALIALDQIDNADLQAQHTIPLLSSNNPYLRRTGLWVSSHHPDWADEVLAHLERELRAPTFAASGGTVQVLHAYMNSSKCRELIGDLLNDTESSPDLTRFLLEIVGNTTLERLPDTWNNGIEQSLESTDSTVRWHALDLIRTRGLDQFDTGLDTIIS